MSRPHVILPSPLSAFSPLGLRMEGVIRSHQLGPREVAKAMELGTFHLNTLMKGSAKCTPMIACRIEAVLGIPALECLALFDAHEVEKTRAHAQHARVLARLTRLVTGRA